ncbi:MAG: oligosaccharide flippase family protein [Elusimicrobiota bacterium]|nr:oligosaccharide flippase family protein [Elusimicrobiota bacterium]
MFKDIKLLGKESAIYGLSTVIARLLNFFLLPFYTHYLTTGDYGIVATVFSYIAFLNILYQYGMDQAYMRYSKENEKTFTSAFAMVFIVSLVFTLILTGNSEFWANASGIKFQNAELIKYAAIILFLDALSIVGFAELRMSHKASYYAFIRVMSIVINLSMNILLIAKLGFGIQGVFIANIVSSSITMVFLAPLYIKRLKFEFDGALAYKLLSFALPLLPAGLGAMAVRVIDRPILLKFSGESAVGIYQANYKLGIFMMLFVSMFDQAWRPFFIERAESADAPKLFARVLTYFLLAGGWIFLAVSFFIEDLVKIRIAGTALIHCDYYAGLSLVPIILGAYLFYGLYVNFLAGIIIRKKTKWIMIAALIGAGANILLNLKLIPLYGMYGAAYAVLISYILMAVMLHEISRRIYPVKYEYSRIFKIFIAIGFYGGLIFLTDAKGINALLMKSAFLLMYPASFWFSRFFYDNEKARIRKVLTGNFQ